MRVVFVSQRFPPDKGGNAARINDLAVNLVDRGWEVTVLSPPPSYPPGGFDRSFRRRRTDHVDGVTVHRLWSWQPQVENPGMGRRMAYYLLFGVHALCWLLWNVRRYDVVVTTTPPISTGAPGLLASALGKPWLVDVRDRWIDASVSLGYLEAGSPVERVSRRFQRLVLHTADRIAVTTETLGDSLAETYGSSLRAKTVTVPNGVDLERFQPPAGRDRPSVDPPADAAHASETRGDSDANSAGGRLASERSVRATDGGEPTIVYTGNLGSAQDLEACIRAMTHLRHDGARLQLVGAGDVESELRRLTRELDLDGRVEFAGVVDREEVPALLAEATVGIAPLQDAEEFAYAMPTKLYEYAASGLPAVVTGRGEIERFVADSGCGLHAENEPERIAEALDRLLADDQLRRRCADGGPEHARSYDRRAIAARLDDELSALVGS